MKKIIFDMDGVITTEQNYWNVAALTIWEHLFHEKDAIWMEENTAKIRKQVFLEDKLISLCKNKGVNSNWDLTYIIYVVAKILNTEDFARIYEELISLDMDAIALYDYLGKQGFMRKGNIWQSLQDTFQEWYLGDQIYYDTYFKKPKLSGKKGLMLQETPLFETEELTRLFKQLKKMGYILGIATGRISIEILQPLKKWDLLKYFDEDSVITFTDVQKAEREFGDVLAKPHPYMFLKALYGRKYADERILAGDYDKEMLQNVIAVGDAGADILCAKAAGMKFVAVLTGVSGERAKDYFKQQGADLILTDVLKLADVLS